MNSMKQINSEQIHNNMHCELLEFKLITLKVTFFEGFCKTLITFNFEEINILPKEVYYLCTASSNPVDITVVFYRKNVM